MCFLSPPPLPDENEEIQSAKLLGAKTNASKYSIGEDVDLQEFAGFRDDESQGAGPATHNCSKVYYFLYDSS